MSLFGFFGVLFLLVADVTCEGDTCRNLEFRSHLMFQGKRLINHVIQTIESAFEDFCGPLCFMEPNCVSYNKEIISGSPSVTKCELNNSTHSEHPDDLKPWQNYIYQGAMNACGTNPCYNNATCQVGFTNRGYRCVCFPGFRGQDCEEDVDECTDAAKHKCHANAVCGNMYGSYNCTCQQGFTGDGSSCADINECASNPCLNGAVCVDQVNGFVCNCQAGYTGTHCENINECASNPCLNGAVCVDQENGFVCNCQAGYTGTHCESKNWIQMTPSSVCFGAKGASYGIFKIPLSGSIITFKLTYLSGTVSCAWYTYSKWGCTFPGMTHLIGTHITDSSRNRLLPKSEYLDNGCGYYNLPWATPNSQKLVFDNFTSTLSVITDQEFQIWFIEDLNECHTWDNGNEKTCAAVYGLYV